MGNLKGAKKQSIAQDTTVCWQLWSQMPSETFPSALLLWRPHHHTPFARTLTLFLLLFILFWFVFETDSYMSQSGLKLTTHLGIRMNFSSSVLCLPHIWVIGVYHCALFPATERSNPGFHRCKHSVLSHMPRRFSKSWSPYLTLFSRMVERLRLSG